MARPSRAAVTLTSQERRMLENWARSRVSSQAIGLRARIILARAEEPTDRAVADRLGISPQLVGRWRSRFLAGRLDGLTDRPRSGRPRAVTGAQRDRVVLRVLEDPPGGGSGWSTRSLAAATGVSQTSVSRIMNALDPGADAPADWFPGRERTIGGVLLDPPVRALAVVLAEDTPPASGAARGSRGTSHRDDAVLVLAAAGAFAAAAPDESNLSDVSEAHTSGFRVFLDRLHQATRPGTEVHILVDGAAVHTDPHVAHWLRRHPRVRMHPVAVGRTWTGDARALLLGNPADRHGTVARALVRDLRDHVRTWLADRSGPLIWVPGQPERHHVGYDSPPDASRLTATSGAGTAVTGVPGSPRLVDRVAHALREQIASGHFPPGERIKEAPLAARLGVSRGPVRDALRLLAEDGLVESMPHRGTTIPMATAERVMEVYAARAALGAVLLRRLATLEPEALHPVGTVLADVCRVARQRDHSRIGDADLRFQDAIARAARLRHTSLFFLRLTMQLRMFIAILKLDYADVPGRIERANSAIFRALREHDGGEAVRVWRAKLDISVRYMVAQLPTENFDPELWLTISGFTQPRDGRRRPH
ncbi:GntR family transcriptional regulator [Streptomyces sp. NPDC059850]|uniref:GntR family transcriptional regulator n=1 Tax=Streptomyces sp. NPDC059850 TaxID=3346970 RepID=UPI003655C7AB